MSPSPRRKRKATVGHISVPDLPGYWPARDGNLPHAVGAGAEGMGRSPGQINTWRPDLLRGDDPVYCPGCHRRDHPGKTCAEHEAYCRSPGHDQLDCECEDPFTCI